MNHQPLSPLSLRILRLDHEGLSAGDIASAVKMSRQEINRVLVKYRARYIIALLGDQGQQLIKDAKNGMHISDLAKKYHIRSIVADRVFKEHYVQPDIVMRRCQHCDKIFRCIVTDFHCPKCGFNNS